VTRIKATCPDCGEVDLTPKDVRLEIGGSGGADSTYGFTCPTCRDFVRKPADERVVRLLLSGGVTPSLQKTPAEALERKDGPPINHDDLLEFHEALQRDDFDPSNGGPA
jgi:hypothetical protein